MRWQLPFSQINEVAAAIFPSEVPVLTSIAHCRIQTAAPSSAPTTD